MKKLLFTAFLATGLLLPASFTATAHSTASKTELSSKKQKKKAKKSTGSSSSKKSKSYSNTKSCTYDGNQLYVGKRGGCYYYAGSSKQYVDRSYCSGCN
ncbi:hypothetical protein [Chryseobacterium sp.]|uniref:hypothetical protein n=1 Tax=Chryseobacterium sp. TaxID=1871047 RepID=UPI000EE915CE|nr:hypothetical protein [Chryseobacterium sp.]HCA05577.1 hypothetical protein [Chryseobacterium sp.]